MFVLECREVVTCHVAIKVHSFFFSQTVLTVVPALLASPAPACTESRATAQNHSGASARAWLPRAQAPGRQDDVRATESVDWWIHE